MALLQLLIARFCLRRSAAVCLMLIHLHAVIACTGVFAVDENVHSTVYPDEFTETYSGLTKKILIAGIELERFILHYRLETFKQPKYRRLRYFAAQEAGAAGLLSFECVGDAQFSKGRNNPSRISQSALKGGLAAFVSTTIVAGSSSCLELGSNVLMARKRQRQGFDVRTASKYVSSKLRLLDQLLSEREAFVSAHKEQPAYARAVVEGRILRLLHDAEAQEFGHVIVRLKQSTTGSSAFYLLNACTDALAATAGSFAYRAVSQPKFNGTTSILFIATGVLGSVSPFLSQVAGRVAGKRALKSFADQVGGEPSFELRQLSDQRQSLKTMLPDAAGSLIPSLPAVDRLALYTESSQQFKKQIDSETATIAHLRKVAVQQNLLAPAINGSLMTQGIIGTAGYYGASPSKQIDLALAGTITGTCGSALAVVATPVSLFAGYVYDRRLNKEHRSPTQLIESRLEHLDAVEKEVLTM